MCGCIGGYSTQYVCVVCTILGIALYVRVYMTDLGGGEIRGNLLRSLYIYIRRGGVTVHAKISCPIERHEPGYRYAIPKSGPK